MRVGAAGAGGRGNAACLVLASSGVPAPLVSSARLADPLAIDHLYPPPLAVCLWLQLWSSQFASSGCDLSEVVACEFPRYVCEAWPGKELIIILLTFGRAIFEARLGLV